MRKALSTRFVICHLVILGLAGALQSGAAAQTQTPANTSVSSATVPLDPGLGISTVRLWDGDAPGSRGSDPGDIPTLTVLRPAHNTGSAIIIAPGGAYRGLSMNLEGREPGDRMAALGMTVFVLRYRLSPKYLYPVPLDDARRAIRLVRSMATQYGYSPDRIGMMGFSAGGHLAAMAATAPLPENAGASDPVERFSSEVNFQVLAYPWLNAMQPQVVGPTGLMINYCSVIQGSTQDPCKGYEAAYTPALHVTRTTPPAFLFHTTDDRTVPVKASVDYYTAMQAAGGDAELHIFAHGPHGSGTGGSDPALSEWTRLLEIWLRSRGLLTPVPKPPVTGDRLRESHDHPERRAR